MRAMMSDRAMREDSYISSIMGARGSQGLLDEHGRDAEREAARILAETEPAWDGCHVPLCLREAGGMFELAKALAAFVSQ